MIFSHPTHVMRSKALIRSGHMIKSPCGIFESSEKYEFNYKFDDAQWEKIFQILKEFFHTFEDVSSMG